MLTPDIQTILLVLLPALIFGGIIYATSPMGSIRFKRGLAYLLFGIFSQSMLVVLHSIFPEWYDVGFHQSPVTYGFFFMFFSVALFEETSKLITFYIGEKIFNKENRAHPVGTMFYGAMNGLGFALIENLGYINEYGGGVMLTRTFTSTVLHMLTGLFIGYWFASGRLDKGTGNRSFLDINLKDNKVLKNILYRLTGLALVICLHGVYNYNLMLGDMTQEHFAWPLMIVILFFSLIGARFCMQDINRRYQRHLKRQNQKECQCQSKDEQ